MNVQEKFQTTLGEINASLIERDEEAKVVMTALLCNEHCLFVGPPGTAKSMLADTMVGWFNCSKFSYTLNKHTNPTELLGPIDVAGYKSGDYRRITHAKLPEAEIAFLDEAMKASSATLNVMLGILNERKFMNGLTEMVCPLRMAIAASNEWPTEVKELGALFDRFLFRKYVSPISGEDNVERLMFEADLTPQLSTSLTMAELKEAQVNVRDGINWSPEAKDCAHEIRRRLAREGVIIGDRRLRKTTMAVKAYAWLNGNPWATKDDLEILAHLWWSSPEGHPEVVADVVTEIARPSGLMASRLLAEANQVYSECDTSNLADSVTACNKLTSIAKQLADMNNATATKAKDRVIEKICLIREGNMASSAI